MLENDEKCYVRFNIDSNGKSYSFNGEYSYDVSWPDVLHDVVSVLESSYGYSFNLDVETQYGTVGIYYPGKDDASE